MSEKAPVIGIDLGTTYSCVAIYRDGVVDILRDQESQRNVVPSIVSFTEKEVLKGHRAKDQIQWNTENTVFDAKRMIGRKFDDPNIQSDMKLWPFKVIDSGGKPMVQVKWQGKEKKLYPEEISSMVLTRMKEIAEDHLGMEVTEAVITVPAYFDNNQREGTRAAAKMAGLKVLRLLQEPVAGAIAYALHQSGEKRNILVYDLGGGTFDVSIMSMDNGIFYVKTHQGNTHLGGCDFDNRMANYFAKDIKDKHKVDVTQNKYAMRRLISNCEKVKIQLSERLRAESTEPLEDLFDEGKYVLKMDRIDFEKQNLDFFESTIRIVDQALKDCKMTKGDIHDVVLVGGSTRIPKIQNMLREYFRRDNLYITNPDEAVAGGAAIQAALLSENRPMDLLNIELYNVLPLSLGTSVIGGIMSVIIPKNTPIPTAATQDYFTVWNNQTEVPVDVYEGEREFVKDNIFLGKTVLTNITPQPPGAAVIKVTFDIDDDCTVHVKGRESGTSNEVNMLLMNKSHRMSEEELGRLVAEAEMNRLSDKMEALRLGAMHELSGCLQDIRSHCDRQDNGLTSQQKKMVLDKVNDTDKWLNGDEGSRAGEPTYKKKMKEIEEVWSPIITECMQNVRRQRGYSNEPASFFD